MQFSTLITVAALSVGALAGNYTNETTVTTDVTVTGYTTYCPESTVIVIKTCTKEVCHPHTTTVTAPATITFTEECLIPTTYTTAWVATTTSPAVVATTEHVTKSTVAAESTSSAVVVATANGANKQVVGAVAGIAAVAAALF